MSDQQSTPAAQPLPDQYEAAAHMYPCDLETFKTGEHVISAFSIPVGSPDHGKSVPLWTSEQMDDHARKAVRAEVERLAAMRQGVPEGMALVPSWKGYALLGTRQYLLNHSKAPPDPVLGAEFFITLATDADKSGDRQVGESRDIPNGGKEMQSNEMVLRIGFLTPQALDALEDQLSLLREENFPESVASLDEEFTQGVNAAAAMLDKMADDYSEEHGWTDPDTGVGEFKRGASEDHYNTLRELADDIRSIVRGKAAAPSSPPAPSLVPEKEADGHSTAPVPGEASTGVPTDTQLLDMVANKYLDVVTFGVPTGHGYANVGWKSLQHHMGEKSPREVSVHYRDDVRACLLEAWAALGITAAQTEPGAAEQPETEICESCSGTGDAGIPRDGRMTARCNSCKGSGERLLARGDGA